MNKKFIALITVFISFSAFAFFRMCERRKESASVAFQQIDSYREVQHVFDACDKNTLVTFDIDDTLITNRDVLPACDGSYPIQAIPFFIIAALKYPSLLLSFLYSWDTKKLDQIGSIISQQAESFVFDPTVIDIIQQLQRQQCTVVALTGMRSGSCGIIKSMPEWRACKLKSLGIDFSGKFQDVRFTSFPIYCGDCPCLYKGILITNRQQKGKVLQAFLDYYQIKPARIISFDDSLTFLNSIAHECTQTKIPFTGYQMMGTKKLRGAWNTRRALFQIDYVMKHRRWLNDQEADALLFKR